MPTPKLLVAALVRNEAGRFLPSALAAWQDFADDVLILDDNSTDNTRELARSFGCIVHKRDSEPMWGRESLARQQLFDLACQHTQPGDYVFVLDADMTPARNPRSMMLNQPGAVAFRLFDMWSPRMYRDDAYWNAHNHPRIWMFRRPERSDWTWNDRGIHCGHLPSNFTIDRQSAVAPWDMGILHFAYSDPELRAAKYAQYASQFHQLGPHEQRHAESIMDPNPRLVPLYFECEYGLVKEDSDFDLSA